MLYISGMNSIEYAMQVFNGTYKDSRGWKHYRVKGNKTCKHIKEIQENR
jgi:hypothetical protein